MTMKQPHPLPPRNYLCIALCLLVMIGAALGIAWHVAKIVSAINADPPPAASVPGAATIDEETDRGDLTR
jgi:hypothetical protein